MICIADFSQSDITMKDMIWMDPDLTNSIYYTRQVLHTKCCALVYWFALNPIVIVSLNESNVLFQGKTNKGFAQAFLDSQFFACRQTLRVDTAAGRPVSDVTECDSPAGRLRPGDVPNPLHRTRLEYHGVGESDKDSSCAGLRGTANTIGNRLPASLVPRWRHEQESRV